MLYHTLTIADSRCLTVCKLVLLCSFKTWYEIVEPCPAMSRRKGCLISWAVLGITNTERQPFRHVVKIFWVVYFYRTDHIFDRTEHSFIGPADLYRTSRFLLQIQQIADRRSQITDRISQIADHRPQITDCRSQSAWSVNMLITFWTVQIPCV